MIAWKWTRLVLYVGSFPIDVLWGWPLVLFFHLIWGSEGMLRFESGALRTRAQPGSWPQRKFGERFAAVTISPHSIIYLIVPLWPEILREPSELQQHEHVHVEQGEAACFAGLFDAVIIFVAVSIAGAPLLGVILGLVKWSFAFHEKSATARLTALLRGEDPYRGSHVEEAAYARQDER